MAEAFAWKKPVAVAALPPDGAEFELVPDAETRVSLAHYAGVEALNALAARLTVKPDGRGGASVRGTLEADVRQTCVVTLEPFDNQIRESVSLRFAPAEAIAPAPPAIELGVVDPPDPLADGKLDLAAVVAEFLVLAIDPYPRKPGAAFVQPGEPGERAESSKFAALEQLKSRGSNKEG